MTVQVRDLSKRFGNRWVLRDVSFEAAKGSIHGIFGASGSGKSTILNGIAGISSINTGTINFEGRSLESGAANYFSTADQTPGFFRFFRPRGKGRSAIEAALESDRKLVLLDDPFFKMDRIEFERSADHLISATRENELVTIIATNTFEEVLRICDSVSVLTGGYVGQTGSPREVYESPASREIAILTGPINIIEARRLTSSKSDIHEFQTIAGEHRLFAINDGGRVVGSLNRNIYLAIRPENVSISFGASFPEDNLLRAVVTGSRFMGATTTVFLESDDLKLQAAVPRLVGLDVGEECMVGLPLDRIRILAK